MSATADTASFARLLDAAPIIESAGRTHPVDIRWRPRTRDERLEPAVTAAVLTALRDEDGDVLAFLPGVAEITRTAERLDHRPASTSTASPAHSAPTSRTGHSRRRHPAGAASCSPPTSPRRR